MKAEILDCGHAPSPHSPYTTGYGQDANGKTHCYTCCAEQDVESMNKTGMATLYLVYDSGLYGKVTNWPGSLSYACTVKRGKHNIAGVRYDVHFTDQHGKRWHGVQYGDMTQVCHCRRLK